MFQRQVIKAADKKKSRPDISYSSEALNQDLGRLSQAYEIFQQSRNRNAIYPFLSAVYDLFIWWDTEGRASIRVHRALWMRGNLTPQDMDPIAGLLIIAAAQLDKRTRCKWSQVLNYVVAQKGPSEPLDRFIKRKGGINACVAHFRRLKRRGELS